MSILGRLARCIAVTALFALFAALTTLVASRHSALGHAALHASALSAGADASNASSSGGAMMDGCRDVLVDLGANLGVHARFLLQPALYPRARRVHAAFAAAFGPHMDASSACVLGVEANPLHVPRLRALEACLGALGLCARFVVPAAAWIADVAAAPLELASSTREARNA
eukprot:CAMPEP_0185837200 /NCGR_PEP_ID=MMETSP1353-20130828/10979_1 /TAXON_ID=1077150 /ORGANISM="Erythrolobus australicus, Strain CCMP3124" /LENGTH=170 /DNA_ID=CAMNT_0028536085 /DNA_START=305 /DNA_END=813 /DNA_ORIENTATION=-